MIKKPKPDTHTITFKMPMEMYKTMTNHLSLRDINVSQFLRRAINTEMAAFNANAENK